MRRQILSLLFILPVLPLLPAHAEDSSPPDAAIALVHRVIADMKASSKDAVIAEINTMGPKYRQKELYVTVMDFSGKDLAHGANKKMQGKDISEMHDIDGKYYVKERIELAKSKGKGWQDYKFTNPETKQIEPKSMYFERYEDLIISCGIYKKP